jgi:transcriptional regulator of heat shock response
MQAISQMFESIDKEKMIAIGKRNAVENEVFSRQKKLSELSILLKEKERELDLMNDQNKGLDLKLAIQEEEMDRIRRC